MIITENQGRTLHALHKLEDSLGVVNWWMEFGTRNEPAPVEIFGSQGTSVTEEQYIHI